jgi:hypothetical protein
MAPSWFLSGLVVPLFERAEVAVPAARRPPTFCGGDVRGECVVELVDVFLAEVDGVFRALIGEGDGVALAFLEPEPGAVEVVDEEFGCVPCHGFSS